MFRTDEIIPVFTRDVGDILFPKSIDVQVEDVLVTVVHVVGVRGVVAIGTIVVVTIGVCLINFIPDTNPLTEFSSLAHEFSFKLLKRL